MGIEIGDIQLAHPVILAPMSGVTDKPFRRLVRELGAGLVVSEMIASEASVRQAREAMRSRKLTDDYEGEHELVVQLAGRDPEVVADAARIHRDRGAAIIDLNFGCPVKKVVTKHAGSALMREEGLAARILEATVKAVAPLPVTLKMRLGWDDSSRNAPRMAQIAEECGIRLLTVHGRTRCQFYGGEADWGAVAEVKHATRLPVIVNGDIETADDVRQALAKSRADGVMIGRGACGRPWRLGQVMQLLARGHMGSEPDVAGQRDIAMRHFEDLLSYYGRERGVRIARKHLGWYAQDHDHAAVFRKAVNGESDERKIRQLLADFYAASEQRKAA